MGEIIFQGKRVNYDKAGKGSVVVLLHGFGENSKVWKKQVEFLQSDYCVIVPDLPGSGNSQSCGATSLNDFAEVINAIMDKESPKEKFHLFGHSMGGYITMAFAEKFGNRLLSFGLIHSSAFEDTEEKKEIRRKGISFIESNGGHAFLKAIIPGLFSEESQKLHPEYLSALMALTENISDNTLVDYYHAMIARPDRTSVLKESQVPVLFIIGRYDQVVPLALSLKQASMPAVASVNLLEHSAHLGMWEEAAAVNKSLLDFLKEFEVW